MELLNHYPFRVNWSAEEAAQYKKLTPEEKLKAFMEIIALGNALIEASPDKEEILRYLDEQEEEGHRFHRELFARFAPPAEELPA
jgi:hypothetical protein